MGPIATQWYEDRNIPFEIRETSGKILPKTEYKHFLESYSCGRIDIYGLDESEHWSGKSEYSVAPMRTEDWDELSDWLDTLDTDELWSYDKLFQSFEHDTGIQIRWVVNN
jgi:hypothetical protein